MKAAQKKRRKKPQLSEIFIPLYVEDVHWETSGRSFTVSDEEEKTNNNLWDWFVWSCIVPSSVSHGGVNEAPATSRLPSEDSYCEWASTTHILIFAFKSLAPFSQSNQTYLAFLIRSRKRLLHFSCAWRLFFFFKLEPKIHCSMWMEIVLTEARILCLLQIWAYS